MDNTKRVSKKVAIITLSLMILLTIICVSIIKTSAKFPRYIVNIETKEGKKISLHIGNHEGNLTQNGLHISYFKVSNIFDYMRAKKESK